MKKNMVIIKPLFLFPLITCVSLSSMDKHLVPSIEIPQPGPDSSRQLSQELQHFIPFQKLKERHASGEYTQSQMNINLIEKIDLIESTHETTPLQLTQFEEETYTIINNSSSNSLLESVISLPQEQNSSLLQSTLSREEKPVSILEWISYKTSTSYGHLQSMIYNLKNNKFDTKNPTHREWLNEAVAIALQNEDVDSLLGIADLCENKYANSIGIADEVAQPASAFLSKHPNKIRTWNPAIEFFAYKTCASYRNIQKIISYLKDDKFDNTDFTHRTSLNQAIATATQYGEIQSLLAIANLCEKNKYKDFITISPEIAQPALALFNTYYTKQVDVVDEELLNERIKEMQAWNSATAACTQAIYNHIHLYNQEIKAISHNYDVTEKQKLECISDLQKTMKAFGSFNRNAQQNTQGLISNSHVKTPTHIFATTMKQTEKKLAAIQKTLEEVPTIQTTQGNPTYLKKLLNLDNK